jgi:hypothetical protein
VLRTIRNGARASQIHHRVFGIIEKHIACFRADSIIVEKCKTGPGFREPDRFYPKMLGYLLRYAFQHSSLKSATHVIVMTDALPVQKKRKAIEKAIRTTLSQMLPSGFPYRLMHHDSKSCYGLQVADYINWAIYRRWDRDDARSLSRVRAAVRSQFDIFRNGAIRWY